MRCEIWAAVTSSMLSFRHGDGTYLNLTPTLHSQQLAKHEFRGDESQYTSGQFDTLKLGEVGPNCAARNASESTFELTQTAEKPLTTIGSLNGTKTRVRRRLPEWFKVRAPGGENYTDLKKRFRGSALHTVCEEAACPNIGDCWERRTATFMILGDTCTRACSYCNVKTGWPGEINVDWAEPFRLAQTVNAMDLKYTVVTSVDRDDLPDYGSSIFAMTITQIHRLTPRLQSRGFDTGFWRRPLGALESRACRPRSSEPQHRSSTPDLQQSAA